MSFYIYHHSFRFSLSFLLSVLVALSGLTNIRVANPLIINNSQPWATATHAANSFGCVAVASADDLTVTAVVIHGESIGIVILVKIHLTDATHAVDREVICCLITHVPCAVFADIAIAIPVVQRTG